MAKPVTHCSCGAAFDSKGKCSACGKPQPRSSGYRAWHGFWCAVATLLLVGCLTTTAAVRAYLKSEALSTALSSVDLAKVEVPGKGDKTVSMYIREEFVSDDNVLQSDVDTAVNALALPKFAANKLRDYADLLRGNTDQVVQIKSDEIVKLLEKNEDQLYEGCLLVIENKDKTELAETLDGPLDTCNAILTGLYGSKALRALAHWRLSTARMLVDVLLLILVLWRWMRVCLKSCKRRDSAIKGMGLTILIPSGIGFLAVALTGLGTALASLFAKDGAAEASALQPLAKAFRGPLYWDFGLWVLVGVALLLTAALLRAWERRQKKPAPAQAIPVAPTHMESISLPQTEELPDDAIAPTVITPMRAVTPSITQTAASAPTASSPSSTPCIACGKDLSEGARFCIYCGAPQTDPSPVADASSIPDAFPDASFPDAPDAALMGSASDADNEA